MIASNAVILINKKVARKCYKIYNTKEAFMAQHVIILNLDRIIVFKDRHPQPIKDLKEIQIIER